jgi:nitrite reductase/ring-hydroxylating ferredoxin subunit
MSSRLFMELRERMGLCYDVNSYVTHFLDDGAFGIYAAVDPSNAAKTVDALITELRRLLTGIPVEELNKARELAKGRMLLRLEDTRAVSGWLGGHLAYARGVGVDVTTFEDDITDWTDAVSDDELLAEQPVVARVGRNDVLLVRRDGRVLALADRCSHRGGPLHDGELVDGCIQCPWHGSRFLLEDGSVARGPASRPQPAYETRVVAGRVQVRGHRS